MKFNFACNGAANIHTPGLLQFALLLAVLGSVAVLAFCLVVVRHFSLLQPVGFPRGALSCWGAGSRGVRAQAVCSSQALECRLLAAVIGLKVAPRVWDPTGTGISMSSVAWFFTTRHQRPEIL